MTYILIIAAIAASAFLAVSLYRALRAYFTFRGKRIVTCPETHQPAAVHVAVGKAALSATKGHEFLYLSQCSRWPERQNCPQDCVAQIEEAPHACLVWTIMNQWYQGQNCAYCHKPFGEIHWHDHPPALVDAERKTVQWNEIAPEHLQEAMRTHLPVCWDCHIAETFRREQPELVVDRPAH